MKLRVGFAGARWLGARILEHLDADTSVDLIGYEYEPEGWWGYERNPLPYERPFTFADADLVVSVLTPRIWKPAEIEAVPFGIVNLHPAPLPQYRGCNSFSHAIINGDDYYATTLHYVDEGIDTGPVIAQEWVHIADDDTARSLYKRTQAASLNLFLREWPNLRTYALLGQRIDATPQNQQKARYYTRKCLDTYRVADSRWDDDKTNRIRRALEFPPFPPMREYHPWETRRLEWPL